MVTTTTDSLFGEYVLIEDPMQLCGASLCDMQSVQPYREAGDPVVARVLEDCEVSNEERGTFRRLTVQWTGTDSSGWFAEYRTAFVLPDHVRLAASEHDHHLDDSLATVTVPDGWKVTNSGWGGMFHLFRFVTDRWVWQQRAFSGQQLADVAWEGRT